MQEADVVLPAVAQADGSSKNRPASLLREMPPYRDLLVCGVSTQLQHEVTGFDDTIVTGDSDFSDSGLKADSLIRLGFLAVLPRSVVLGTVGHVSAERRHRLLNRLSDHLVAGL